MNKQAIMVIVAMRIVETDTIYCTANRLRTADEWRHSDNVAYMTSRLGCSTTIALRSLITMCVDSMLAWTARYKKTVQHVVISERGSYTRWFEHDMYTTRQRLVQDGILPICGRNQRL
jgi:hypothetical protein